MKKLFLSVMTLAAALAFVPSANVANAQMQPEGAGTWDYMTWERAYVTTSFVRFGKLVESGGGDYKVDVIENGTGGTLTVKLWESDDGGYSGTLVREIMVSGTGEAVFNDIGQYVDGDNNKAEFFIEVKTAGKAGYVSVEYYD